MIELKFRYRIQYSEDNHIGIHFFTIKDIENHKGLNKKSLFESGIKILSRDRYTGLKDKNNKEIYEKDIISNWTASWIIKWENDSDYCGFIAERICDEWHELFINHNWRDSRIIGNIYENPELLIKKGKL